ncbi:hypothetical protein Airi01_034890 [Actinoallomurus iriomotensis]|uniref:GTPase HflX N-terminal domain-containing protein n=1 Tax=Actinoallomurus iriomotensis TaxID=478107 RepID=A0A9W6RJK0_9ACTN|nr:hypothetical protein Airi01_034890 [Actinoallomurus iriomotensis]
MANVIHGANVVVAGLFSARRKDHVEAMDELEAEVTRFGGLVTARFVQRRGVSGKGRVRGGAENMDRPYSSRTLMSTGKIREIADACVRTDATAVVFHNDLTDRQRRALSEIFGSAVLTIRELKEERRVNG